MIKTKVNNEYVTFHSSYSTDLNKIDGYTLQRIFYCTVVYLLSIYVCSYLCFRVSPFHIYLHLCLCSSFSFHCVLVSFYNSHASCRFKNYSTG